MAELTIGEVEKLTGVKAHILRYWEEHISFLNPRKDMGGRRVYSEREVQIVLRLRHLIQEKKFTLEGAREQLFTELTGEDEPLRVSLRSGFDVIRSELIRAYAIIQRRKGSYEQQTYRKDKEGLRSEDLPEERN
ncbi:MAG: MerR family transcriptional regulator [Spirochaetaceae bacterium]|jgi:DNA-binding transcriptional MerR regulator|nr:MerR family transcriptional regulator [Spirochaetaceae bacterium]